MVRQRATAAVDLAALLEAYARLAPTTSAARAEIAGLLGFAVAPPRVAPAASRSEAAKPTPKAATSRPKLPVPSAPNPRAPGSEPKLLAPTAEASRTRTLIFDEAETEGVEPLAGDGISVGAPFFEMTFAPVMAPHLLTVPFGPMLAWKRGDI